MATLRKRKNKNGVVYLVDFRFNGRRFIRSTRTDDLRTAKLVLKDIEAKIAKNTFSIEQITPKRKVYLKQFTSEFIDYSRAHKAEKTVSMDRSTLKHFVEFVGDRPIDSIDRKLIDLYLNSRVQRVKHSSVNVELRHLKAAFSKAVTWSYVKKNPFKGVKLFRIPQATPTFFSKKELSELMSSIEESWMHDIILFDVNTGLRRTELVNLEWSDISFEKEVIKVSQKSDFTTKSKKERIIPMNDDVLSLLTQMTRKGRYVFSTSEGAKYSAEFISKRFKKCLRAAGFSERFTFHSLRHTFASHLVQSGVSLYIVSKLLGHADTKTTEVYAHLSPETFQHVVALLDFQNTARPHLSLVRNEALTLP